jgi:hypothetical protein
MGNFIKIAFPPSFFAVTNDVTSDYSFATYDEKMVTDSLQTVGAEKDIHRTAWFINGKEIRFKMGENNNLVITTPGIDFANLGFTQDEMKTLYAYSLSTINRDNKMLEKQFGLLGITYAAMNAWLKGVGLSVFSMGNWSHHHLTRTDEGILISHRAESASLVNINNGQLKQYDNPVVQLSDQFVLTKNGDKASLNINEDDFLINIDEEVYKEIQSNLLLRMASPRPLNQDSVFTITPFLTDPKFADAFFDELVKRSRQEQQLALKSIFSYYKDKEGVQYDQIFSEKLQAYQQTKKASALTEPQQYILEMAMLEFKESLYASEIFADPLDIEKIISQRESEAQDLSGKQLDAFIVGLSGIKNLCNKIRAYDRAHTTNTDGISEQDKQNLIRAQQMTVKDNIALAKILFKKPTQSKASQNDINKAIERIETMHNFVLDPRSVVNLTALGNEVNKVNSMKHSVVKTCLKGGLTVLFGVGLGLLSAGLTAAGILGTVYGVGIPIAALGILLGVTAIGVISKGVAILAAKPTAKEAAAASLQQNMKLFSPPKTLAENPAPNTSTKRGGHKRGKP